MNPEDRVMDVLQPGQALTVTHISALACTGRSATITALENLEYLGLVRQRWVGDGVQSTKVFERTGQVGETA